MDRNDYPEIILDIGGTETRAISILLIQILLLCQM